MRLKEDIPYHCAPYGFITTIPKGTECVPAKNMPEREGKKSYWAKGWRGMSREARGWKKNYGFLIEINK